MGSLSSNPGSTLYRFQLENWMHLKHGVCEVFKRGRKRTAGRQWLRQASCRQEAQRFQGPRLPGTDYPHCQSTVVQMANGHVFRRMGIPISNQSTATQSWLELERSTTIVRWTRGGARKQGSCMIPNPCRPSLVWSSITVEKTLRLSSLF